MILSRHFLGSILISCCLLTSCGRKQRTTFNFDTDKKIKINKLSFPAVKGIRCKSSTDTITISWLPITHKNFIGYNIYHATQGLVAHKKPLNKALLHVPSFSHKTKNSSYYLVRAVFTLHMQTIEGPASQLCCCR